jgi:Protein O-mannosyl-transferase TMEM260-like
MSEKQVRRIIGAIIFIITTVVLFLTVQPSVSFWDPGEIAAASYSLMVPHPPGGPLWLLIGRVFSMIPFAHDIGFRINMVSVLSGSFSILLLYLVCIKVIESYRGKKYNDIYEASFTYVSAAIGALALAFCDTFWFNAVEANYFALSTFLFSLIVWLMMIWYEKSEEQGNEKYIILMAYLVGLSFGVHLMSVLPIFTFVAVVVMKKYVTDDEAYKKTAYLFTAHMAILVIIALGLWSTQTSNTPPSPAEYQAFDSKFLWIMVGASAIFMAAFWKRIFHRNSFYIPLIVAAVALGIAYPGIVKIFPSTISAIAGGGVFMNALLFVVFIAIVFYVIRWAAINKKEILHIAGLCLLFAVLGYTTYAMIIIRSNETPPMNENKPDNFSRFIYYLDREQYGDFPIFKRRFSSESNQMDIYTNYSSDLDFFWKYQFNHMFNRYLLWNFVGRKSTVQDAGVKWSQLYGIPFLIGMIGLFMYFKRDWKMASAWLILFIIMGYLIAFYQNQQDPQPRERFYFYAGAWFVFAVWIAVGVYEITNYVKDKVKSVSFKKTAAFACLAGGLLLIPCNMFRTNYFTHDRSRNWLPWDFAYNLLQSCAPNAILFTNGDNDTFPLWFLQDVEGVRRDIRVVCLSLANTDWYVEQLKNTSPYGAEKVKFSMTDAQINNLQPVEWTPQQVSIPVSKEAIKKFDVTDTSVINSGKMTFEMDNTVQFGDIKAVRVQDLVVKDIVQSNTWDRPIYFASTCSSDAFIGMDDYLELEGLAERLVPEKGNVMDVNSMITKEDLFNLNPSYSKTYKPGFKFRGIDDSTIFFNDTQQRLIQNYRNTYVRLAYYYHNTEHNNEMVIKTLNKMNQVIPDNVIPMDYRYMYDIANLYYSSGDDSTFKAYAAKIIPDALQNLDASVNNLRSPYNSFSMLERIYVNLREYDKAIDILNRLESMYPGVGGVKGEIAQIQAMKKMNEALKDTVNGKSKAGK